MEWRFNKHSRPRRCGQYFQDKEHRVWYISFWLVPFKWVSVLSVRWLLPGSMHKPTNIHVMFWHCSFIYQYHLNLFVYRNMHDTRTCYPFFNFQKLKESKAPLGLQLFLFNANFLKRKMGWRWGCLQVAITILHYESTYCIILVTRKDQQERR